MTDKEDPNKLAKEVQAKFAAAMNPETVKGEVVYMKEHLMMRIIAHQAQAEDYMAQAVKLNSVGDVNKCPFAAPLLAKANAELAAIVPLKEHVQFIIQREHELAVAKIVPIRPVAMNWNMGPKPPSVG